MIPFRFPPPDSAFLPQIAVDAHLAPDGSPVVTLHHPNADIRSNGAETAMLAIALRLGLSHGRHAPRTGAFIYNIGSGWYLDYHHPRDVLHFAPPPMWAHRARRVGGARVTVSLERHPNPSSDGRILTGRLALRREAHHDWAFSPMRGSASAAPRGRRPLDPAPFRAP
ncbi:hypothetical protein ACWGHM_34575 [Streptomyces sp. NPDC054904]